MSRRQRDENLIIVAARAEAFALFRQYEINKLIYKDFDVVYAKFLASKIYNILQNTHNVLWAESSGFIADDNYRELKYRNKKTNKII
ncbi:MAG: hypothetical protein LBE04_05540 [Prevotellaceae bacterium]|jgi:hypothetical protein|nr:hypothetical protein [Prevotellaceae bacterium]